MGPPCEIAGIVCQACLIGQKLLPRDIRRIHPVMDRCPLFQRAPDLTELARSSIGMGASAPIDEGSCVGWIVQNLTQSSLSGFAPDELTGVGSPTLVARQENAIIAQAPEDFLTTAQGLKTSKDQLDGSLHL